MFTSDNFDGSSFGDDFVGNGFAAFSSGTLNGSVGVSDGRSSFVEGSV